MLVPKPSHFFSLAFTGMIFVLPLSSCNSGEVTQNGAGGASAAAAAAGRATTGSAGSGLTASGGAATAVVAGSGGAATSVGGGSFSSGGGVGGVSNSGGAGSGGMAPACTDKQIPDPDHAKDPCSIWPEYDAANPPGTAKNCDASWLTGAGYCLESCGKCKSSTGSGGSGSGAGGGSGGGFSTGLGPGPALPDVPTSNKVYWASRYWDCCKPHCSTNGNIKSCGIDGVSQNGGGSACSGGSAYACYSQAPRYIGDNVSYGYVAVPNPSCGTCYHLQFTGTGQHNMNDPGSKNIPVST